MRQLFLDDERIPGNVTWISLYAGHYDVARDMKDFKNYVKHYGIPDVISFDNDLGKDEPQGYECAKWMCEEVMDGNLTWNPNFKFTVHSKNNIAADLIQSYLTSFIQHMNTN